MELPYWWWRSPISNKKVATPIQAIPAKINEYPSASEIAIEENFMWNDLGWFCLKELQYCIITNEARCFIFQSISIEYKGIAPPTPGKEWMYLVLRNVTWILPSLRLPLGCSHKASCLPIYLAECAAIGQKVYLRQAWACHEYSVVDVALSMSVCGAWSGTLRKLTVGDVLLCTMRRQCDNSPLVGASRDSLWHTTQPFRSPSMAVTRNTEYGVVD